MSKKLQRWRFNQSFQTQQLISKPLDTSTLHILSNQASLLNLGGAIQNSLLVCCWIDMQLLEIIREINIKFGKLRRAKNFRDGAALQMDSFPIFSNMVADKQTIRHSNFKYFYNFEIQERLNSSIEVMPSILYKCSETSYKFLKDLIICSSFFHDRNLHRWSYLTF